MDQPACNTGCWLQPRNRKTRRNRIGADRKIFVFHWASWKMNKKYNQSLCKKTGGFFFVLTSKACHLPAKDIDLF